MNAADLHDDAYAPESWWEIAFFVVIFVAMLPMLLIALLVSPKVGRRHGCN